MRRFTIPILSLALLLVLFGCTQGGIPSACAGSSVEKLPNCVYVAAVLEQNPFNCYSLSNISQKEQCLRDASDSSIKKLLEAMSPAERAKIFSVISGEVNTSRVDVPPLPPVNESADPNLELVNINLTDGVSEADSKAYAHAVAINNITACAPITHASTRSSCIAQVALRVKNPSMCSQFTLASDIDLCNFYAKGN